MAKMDEKARLLAITAYEAPLWHAGVRVGGVDEVGRGPLAGPVLAACVILPPEPLIEGITDSKKISPKKRERLSEQILKQAIGVGFGLADEATIDRINIRQATLCAMRDAVLAARAAHVLVDAETVPVEVAQTRLVHGDALSYLIGAASIVAKVRRDAMMTALDAQYPQYGFARNKGYGTAEHIAAIRKYGLCPCHRRSFTAHLLAP